ncbi:MAG: hypothetical protein E7256_11475 [Lachnospiraceae bacterium]|nr:hypothetical protein [Lachnospiraceae bacterium]
MEAFELNRNTCIETAIKTKPVFYAKERFYEDLERTLKKTGSTQEKKAKKISKIHLLLSEDVPDPETFVWNVTDEQNLYLTAKDELGLIYGLIHISERYLGILPLWFFCDQQFEKKECVQIEPGVYQSKPAYIRYRGWFINDEVLLTAWRIKGDSELPWKMAFDALLRLGGNMVIPGTDKNAHVHNKLAMDMGLIITHHHAEPLGAMMFSRAYPDLTPSYKEYPDLFLRLWEDAIERQKDRRVVWNLGFRGQGDCPFWMNDPMYATGEQRGKLISDLIQKQYDLVCEKVDHPVCCTNLYGEVMELYKEGYIHIPDEVIKIWADNGYGKMVSRRQDNVNPRVPALPDVKKDGTHHGIYYHVSFYDLQAANHITMFPNSMEFLCEELEHAFESGVRDYLIVNGSNIRPHVYSLSLVARLWKEGKADPKQHLEWFLKNYYQIRSKEMLDEMAVIFNAYPGCMAAYGDKEDEHAGEQFYNYITRICISALMKGNKEETEKSLLWFHDGPFSEQIAAFRACVAPASTKLTSLFEQYEERKKRLAENKEGNVTLLDDTIGLWITIHLQCANGSLWFCKAFESYKKGCLKNAFFESGKAAAYFDLANMAMQQREHDKWLGFYQNDCLTDVKFTAYLLRQFMGWLRNLGDGPHFYKWQRDVTLSEEDRRVMLITNMHNHMTTEELFQAMSSQYGDDIL